MRTRSLFVGITIGFCTIGFCTMGVLFAAAAPTAPPTTLVGAPVSSLPPPDATDPATGLPAARGPLAVLPAGCVTPAPALAVFEGKIVAAVSTTARFEVVRVLAGALGRDEVGGQTDVQYGDETRFLAIGSTYIVGVARVPKGDALISTVREPAPLFGGDAVIGINNSDVACGVIGDPVRTILLDGTPVDTGVLAPLHGQGSSVLSALARPALVAFAILLGVVLVKHLVFATARAIRDTADAASSRRS